MKVWSGMSHYYPLGQVHTIIATESKKKAAELLSISLYEFNQYWSETGNKEAIAAAMKKPETILIEVVKRITVYEEPKR
jgi:hypothetical protein